MKIDFDVAIIGGGVAGLAAAMYSGRFGLKTAVFDDKVGGTIMLTHVVENYPGIKVLTGMDLSERLKKHALVYKPQIIETKIDKLEKKDGLFILTSGKKKYISKTVIFATGTQCRKLNVPGEKEFANKGVHYCAMCDGHLYKNKILGVVGGSDSAAKDALLLTQFAKKVYIIYRKEKIRAEPINYERVMKNKKIEIINNTNVVEILGKSLITKVKLDKPYKDCDEFELDGLFIDIGHVPMTELAKGMGVKLNERGEVIADKLMQTNVPGFFAAGDVSDTPFKQAITAASEGSTAAYSAYDYVKKNK